MTQRHFDAILAKNNIAELIEQSEPGNMIGEASLSTRLLVHYLEAIEAYTVARIKRNLRKEVLA